MLGIEAGVVGKVDVDGERRLAELGYGGGVTPVEDGRREVARELREREAKLFAWSIWAERLWNSEATAGWSSSAFTVERRRVLGSGSEEQPKGRTD